MGALCCSYFLKNNVAKLREGIEENNPDEIVKQIKEGTLKNVINSEIDSLGNTPLMLSIENRSIDGFKHLIDQPNLDPNRANAHTGCIYRFLSHFYSDYSAYNFLFNSNAATFIGDQSTDSE